MMQFAHAHLNKTRGLNFYKLLGTGKGSGFNPLPDWSTYALLQVWDSESEAESFMSTSQLIAKYQKHTTEICTIFMKNMIARGLWSGCQPFQKSSQLEDNSGLAVITRATIKWSKLITFWKYVPTSERSLVGNKGLVFKKGIGEAPIVQMATFSLWKDEESLMEFAYKSAEHKGAIDRTKKLNWYKEELFSRFQPYKSTGTWDGKDLLEEL